MVKIISFLRNIKHLDINIRYLLIRNKMNKMCPKIVDENETVKLIKEQKLSVSRFGDGEFRWMTGIKNDSFQQNDIVLAERLKEILNSNVHNHIICIPNNLLTQQGYVTINALAWKMLLVNYWRIWLPILDKKKTFFDANFTRPYIDRRTKDDAKTKFKNVKKIWENKSVLIIEGEKTKFGVANDLLDNVKKIGRVICPAINAFSKYDTILSKAMKIQENYDLILIALGPTATVLSYDLAKNGCSQSIDIGHLDIEYEWFRKGTMKRTPIPNKYVNEVTNGTNVTSHIENEKYSSEIKCIIR